MCLICRSATVWDRNLLQFRGPLWGLWKKEKNLHPFSIIEHRTIQSVAYSVHWIFREHLFLKKCTVHKVKMDVVNPINLCTDVHI